MTDHFSPAVLRAMHERGVSLGTPTDKTVRCNACTRAWKVPRQAGGAMPRRWWACPNDCNV